MRAPPRTPETIPKHLDFTARHCLRIANAEVAAERLDDMLLQSRIKRCARLPDVRDAITVAYLHGGKKNPCPLAMHAIREHVFGFTADRMWPVDGYG